MLSCFRALLFASVTVLLLPLLAAVSAVILSLNLFYSLTRSRRNLIPEGNPPGSGLASIVVLNWNGKELLARGLPSILEAVRADGREHEILVVDNGSSDGSREYLERHFPQVRVLALEQNLGFGEGNNAGVRAARHDLVVLLNNDMIVDRGFLRPLLRGFGPRTFAVSSQIYLQDSSKRREETGKTSAVYRRGMIDYSHCEIDGRAFSRDYYPVFWAGGGSSAFHRQKFLALGGFHRLFSPAYVEDADLSFRAWQSGWEVLLAPRSIVHHAHRSSTGRRFSQSALQSLILRNQYLFIWKNIHDWRLVAAHCFFLPWNSYRLARDHGTAAWAGFFRAVLAIASIIPAIWRDRRPAARKDTGVFELFAKPWRSLSKDEPPTASGTTGGKARILWLTAYLPHTGRHAGAGRMFQLLKRLSSRYRITLATFLESDDERELLSEVEPLCEKVIALRRYRPPRWQLFAYEPFDEFRTPEMTQVVDTCLEESDFDLLQLEYTQMACYADRAPGIPALLTKHEVDFAACARRARMETGLWGKLRWFYNYLQVLDRETKLTAKVDAVVCMTDPDTQELKKFCPSVPIYTINTGVDLDYFRPRERQPTGARLIFVGAFQHLPNVDAMLYFCRNVLPLIRARKPETELWIVGSNPSPPVLSLADVDGVHVTGFVPDIRPLMAESSVYIVPLRLGVGIRGKILEAWGMEMAVVATTVGCAGLHFEDGRNLLVGDSPGVFAKQVLSLLQNPEQRRRLGQEGRRTVEQHYSWEKSAAKLDALYRGLIRNRNSSEAVAAAQSTA